MKPAWHELGYPDQHHDAIRSASRYTAKVIAVTGTVFISLLLGSVYWLIPPVSRADRCRRISFMLPRRHVDQVRTHFLEVHDGELIPRGIPMPWNSSSHVFPTTLRRCLTMLS